jgi:predicted  nucleic acid-binding Zn-ribbon protein
MDDITSEIAALTVRLWVYRAVRREQDAQMARLIEIKGLGTDIASIKKGIGDLRAAAGELNTQHAGLKAEIVDLTDQIKQHREDLKFEAETLGNSSASNGQEETAEKPEEPPSLDEVAKGILAGKTATEILQPQQGTVQPQGNQRAFDRISG